MWMSREAEIRGNGRPKIPRPEGLRRPILIMAFGGWNDAAESATTAVRYLGTSFRPRSSPRSTRRSSITSACPAPTSASSRARRRSARSRGRRPSSRSARRRRLARDLIVGVAIEPHLRWKTYCGVVLDLARRCEVTLVLTLGALLAEVPHTRPVRLSGSASDPELAVRLGVRPTKYEGPTGIVGVLNTVCREQGFADGEPLGQRPALHLGHREPQGDAGAGPTRRAAPGRHGGRRRSRGGGQAVRRQPERDRGAEREDRQLHQEARVAGRRRGAPPAAPAGPSDLPPASELVAEIEQFLRQQRPE